MKIAGWKNFLWTEVGISVQLYWMKMPPPPEANPSIKMDGISI